MGERGSPGGSCSSTSRRHIGTSAGNEAVASPGPRVHRSLLVVLVVKAPPPLRCGRALPSRRPALVIKRTHFHFHARTPTPPLWEKDIRRQTLRSVAASLCPILGRNSPCRIYLILQCDLTRRRTGGPGAGGRRGRRINK
jgi:hypothetical protein